MGVLANNGVTGEQEALKGAHFVQLCTQRSVPLVFLHNSAPDSQLVAQLQGKGRILGNSISLNSYTSHVLSVWSKSQSTKNGRDFSCLGFRPYTLTDHNSHPGCEYRDNCDVTTSSALPGDALGRTLVAHAKFMSSVAAASVAKVTVITGNSFGANNFMMVT